MAKAPADRMAVPSELRPQYSQGMRPCENEQDYPSHFLAEKTIKGKKSKELGRGTLMKQRTALEGLKQYEPDIWKLDVRAENMLAFIYKKMDEEQLALDTYRKVLEKEPYNLIALTGSMYMLKKLGEFEERRKTLGKLELLHSCKPLYERLHAVAKAEYAFFYGSFGYEFYPKAIDLYHEALDNEEAGTENQRFLWHCSLAQKYNQMLNKGNFESLGSELNTFDPDTYFIRIKSHLEKVISGQSAELVGRAWCELGDAYKKYETSGYKSERHRALPDRLTCEQCMDDAIKCNPTDPHVLERVGRHFRQAGNFKEAITIFEYALRLCPTRHVVLHQLALANKALWHIESDLPEAELYRKPSGRKKKNRKQKKQNTPHATNQYVGDCHVQPGYRDGSDCVYGGIEQLMAGCSVNAEAPGNPTMDGQEEDFQLETQGGSRIPRSVINKRSGCQPSLDESRVISGAQVKTVLPRRKRDNEQVPCQQYQSRFDVLKASNPTALDGHSKTYLEKAVKYLEEANKITFKVTCPYLVDLARCYVSLQEFEKARDCFIAATRTNYNSSDGAYLYEQWGLFREGNDSDKDVMEMFKKSVEYAVKARIRSKVAYAKLDKYFNKEIHKDPTNLELKSEKSYLNVIVNNPKKAKEAIKQTLRHSGSIYTCLEELINLYARQGEFPHACAYIPKLLCDCAKNEKSLKNIQLATLHKVIINAAFPNAGQLQVETTTILEENFRAILKFKYGISESADGYDVALIASTKQTLGYERIKKALEDYCNLNVFACTTMEDPEDILSGPIIDQMIDHLVEAHVIVIFTDELPQRKAYNRRSPTSEREEDWQMNWLLSEILKWPKKEQGVLILVKIQNDIPSHLVSLPCLDFNVQELQEDDIEMKVISDFFGIFFQDDIENY